MDKKNKQRIILLVFSVLWVISLIVNIEGGLSKRSTAESIVPISKLPLRDHLILIRTIWPNIATVICIILFPLIFVPLFMKLKNKVWFKYKNGYIDIPPDFFAPKKFVKRAIYVFLLTMGLSATIIASGYITATDFLPPDERYYWVEVVGITNPLYITDVFLEIAALIYPFAIGLWAIGWAIEDSGLMHYKLPEGKDKMLYEIEPVHLKYMNIIKGYAGISAVVYFIAFITFYLTHEVPLHLATGAITIIPLFTLVTWLPAYLVYTVFLKKFLIKFLRKNKKEISAVTEEQILVK